MAQCSEREKRSCCLSEPGAGNTDATGGNCHLISSRYETDSTSQCPN